MDDIRFFLIPATAQVKEAMKRLDQMEGKTLYVVDPEDRLLGALTDGDIRRYLMNDHPVENDLSGIFNRNPIRIRSPFDLHAVRQMMVSNRIESVPVVDADQRIIDVLLWEAVRDENRRPTRRTLDLPVIIMAGGKGARLDPFTRILPKPLVPIDQKPVIEWVMERFLEHGITTYYLSVNHKSRILKAYFEEWNPQYRIRWIEEEQPLGTAGSLKLLEGKISETFFVTNCDIIVNMDCAAMLDYHQSRGNDMTLAVSIKRYHIPYGICEIQNDGSLIRIREKPEYDLLVNIGLYLVNQTVLRWIPAGQSFDFTDLISAAQTHRGRVGVYPIEEDDWIDVGQWELYQKAIRVFQGQGSHAE